MRSNNRRFSIFSIPFANAFCWAKNEDKSHRKVLIAEFVRDTLISLRAKYGQSGQAMSLQETKLCVAMLSYLIANKELYDDIAFLLEFSEIKDRASQTRFGKGSEITLSGNLSKGLPKFFCILACSR